jgi:cysteine desulfurase
MVRNPSPERLDVVYLDHHATTPVDPRVLEAMTPYFTRAFGNPASVSHAYGWQAREAVDEARASIAAAIGAGEREIIFTSGATESNNLALRGVAERARRRGNHLISVATEHKAVLDPLAQLARRDFEVTLLDVEQAGSLRAGWLDPARVAAALRPDTLLVSVMLANNEIGVVQSLSEIGRLAHERGALVHCDATQAVGKMPILVAQLGVDLMSFSAHKFYGPKGVGALYVRRSAPPVRLEPQIAGGGHEAGLRSGTLNVPGIVGMARALELCLEEMPAERERLAALRDRLWSGLRSAVPGVTLNGPALDASTGDARSSDAQAGDAASNDCRRGDSALRLPGNLNVAIAGVDGEALILNMRRIAVSSGSACTSANPEPSHVLRAIGLDADAARSSVRFGLGRFNTPADIELAIATVAEGVARLRNL